MALPEGKVSEQAKGQTDDNDQVSEGNRQTVPQTDGGTKEIDLSGELTTKFILNPKRPDMIFTGEQIRNMVGLGKMVSEKESELHKTQEKLRETEEVKSQLERELEMARINRRIEEIESRSSQKEEDVLAPYYEQEEQKPVIDEKVIRQQIDPIVKETEKRFASFDAKLQSFEERQAERERKEAFAKFGEATQKARKDSLQRTFGTLSESEIDKIVANESAARMLEIEANNRALQLDDDGARELIAEADGYRDTAMSLRAQALIKEQRAKALKDAQETLLKGPSIDEIKVTDDLMKPALNPKDAEKKAIQLREIAKKKAEARAMARRNLG